MKNKIGIICGVLMLIISGLIYFNNDKKITKEETVEIFCDNIDSFNVVRDYMLAQPKDHYINISAYKTEIDDPKVLEAVEYLLKKLKYKRIYNYSELDDKDTYYIIFSRDGNNKDDFGIIYTKNKGNDYGVIMDLIKDNWYFHWIGYV